MTAKQALVPTPSRSRRSQLQISPHQTIYRFFAEAPYAVSCSSEHCVESHFRETEPVLDLGVATDDRCASTSSSDDATFRLNIGGKSYRFRPDVILECRHESLLSMLIRADHSKRLMFTDGFRSETGEYYLERNIRVAEHIADYYITGIAWC